MTTQYPVVKPVIELDFNSLPLSPSEKLLLEKIIRTEKDNRYIKTPDGWFVPLSDLQDHIQTVAELIIHQTKFYDELEIGGGFVIWVDSFQALEIPIDSTFRFAMDLANSVIDVKIGSTYRVAVGTHDYWTISMDKDNKNNITIIRGSNKPDVSVPLSVLRDQFKSSQTILIEFSSELENCINQSFKDLKFSSIEFKKMFGLDKVQ